MQLKYHLTFFKVSLAAMKVFDPVAKCNIKPSEAGSVLRPVDQIKIKDAAATVTTAC